MTAQSVLGNLANLNWRIWFGLTLTVGWIVLGIAYVSSWTSFSVLPADELGSFLEGAFAPLAFLWLVIGYFLQQKELQQNTDALRAQATEIRRLAEQAVIQSEKLAQSEMHARQEAFLQIANSVNGQLGSLAGLLFLSSQCDTRSEQEISELLSSQNSGVDSEAFSRRLFSISLRLQDPKKRFDLFSGTEVRARHTNNFIFTFERLMRRAQSVDTDDMIQDSLSASGHGFLYRVLKRRHLSNGPITRRQELISIISQWQLPALGERNAIH